MERYQDLVLDEERALYGLKDARVERCRFEGAADGESALKECSDIRVEDCDFSLRYPLWHVHDAHIARCRMRDTCRAALWYCSHITLDECAMEGIKALRECDGITLLGGFAASSEFGWKCRNLKIDHYTLESEYPFFMSDNMDIDHLEMKGKYSFQYVRDTVIRNSVLNTKDAFWHSENTTVIDSVINGEYLAWYSVNLKLIRCHVSGTQPLCYCKGLQMIDCTMDGADFAFERSDVNASIRSHVISVKNPIAGSIQADSIGELILDKHCPQNARCRIDAHIEKQTGSD